MWVGRWILRLIKAVIETAVIPWIVVMVLVFSTYNEFTSNIYTWLRDWILGGPQFTDFLYMAVISTYLAMYAALLHFAFRGQGKAVFFGAAIPVGFFTAYAIHTGMIPVEDRAILVTALQAICSLVFTISVRWPAIRRALFTVVGTEDPDTIDALEEGC